MLRICADSKTLTRLSVEPPASIDVSKRQTLLNCIANAPDVFFDEIGEKLLLLGSDLPGFGPGDSIDLLAVDPKGSISVIELSGQAGQQQLIRALSHAALISKCSRDRLLTGVDRRVLMNFLPVQISEVNRRQRVVLSASAFDDDALIAAGWLSGTYGVEIICIRITVIVDDVARTEYLECDRLFPLKQPRDVRAHAVHRPPPPRSTDRAEDMAVEVAAGTDTDFGPWADLASLSEGVGWALPDR